MTKEANESLTNNVMSMHLLPKSIEVEKKETEFEKKKRIGVPTYDIEQLMKECDVDKQWTHVRHVPKCDEAEMEKIKEEMEKVKEDKVEGTEEYGKKEEKEKPWSVKFDIKDDTRYKLVAGEKTYEGKMSERKYFDELWKDLSIKGGVELHIEENLHSKLADNHIDTNTFWSLSEGEFKDIVGISSFGKRKRFVSRIEELKEEHNK
jgi:hypothetical protein